MRLRRQLFAATVHTTAEARRPITLTLAGLKFDIVAKILACTPRLTDAACIGQPALFDPQGDSEPAAAVADRHYRAAALCNECPALAECGLWSQTERHQVGVIAGRIPPQRGRPTKRGDATPLLNAAVETAAVVGQSG